MTLIGLVSDLWALMGSSLRRWTVAVLGVALVALLLLFGWLFYSTGEMYRQFGILPTKGELIEQTESIREDMATGSEVENIGTGLRAYQDSLGRLRTHFDTALITPGLNAIIDLQKRMAQLERGQVETKLAIEEQKQQGQLSTDALIDQMNEQSNAEERAKERERDAKEEQDRQDRELMQAIAKKLKIETKRF